MALNIPLSLDSILHLLLSLILMCKKMLFSEHKQHHNLLVTIWEERVHRNTSHIRLGCICGYRSYKYPEYKGIAYINTPIYNYIALHNIGHKVIFLHVTCYASVPAHQSPSVLSD